MHSTRLREVLALALAAALPLFAGGPPENDSRREEDRVLAQTGLVDPALVVAWNQTMNDIGFADPTAFLKPIRAHAMMHIAMHDALNAVVPLYRQYAYRSHDPGAHAIAAAAQAAYQVGISQYPDQQGKLDAELARWLSKIPDTPHKSAGHRSRPAERGRHPRLARERRLGLPGHVHVLK